MERTRHLVPVVRGEELLAAPDATVVDLRSPGEFADDHVPGAVNLPLLDDVARSLVGRLYHRASPEAAFGAARATARERIGELAAAVFSAAGERAPGGDVAELYERMTADGLAGLEEATTAEPDALPERAVVLHCWRGGLRSRSVVALMRQLGLQRAVGLADGYRGYRALVRAELTAWRAPRTFVLRGLTGVGKTLVLRELARLRPGWTLDLEALAGHRSSILGMVGLQPVSQKTFESRLALRLRRDRGDPLVLEGESRKVGDVILPPTLWGALEDGVSIELTAPVERRVAVLLADYLGQPSSRAQLRGQLPFLEQRLGRSRWAGRLVGLLDAGREAELAGLLLEKYYDPLYRHSELRHAYAHSVDATDPGRAAAEVVGWVRARLEQGDPP